MSGDDTSVGPSPSAEGLTSPRPSGDRKRALKVFAFVVVAGPLLGALVFIVPMLVAALYALAFEPSTPPTSLLEDVKGVLSIILFMSLFGYLLGAAAALVCAIVLAFSVYRWGDISFLWTLGVGAISSIAGQLLRDAVLGDTSGGHVVVSVIPALVAAILGWLLMRKFGWIGKIGKTSFTQD